jgi:hypothetical protein
MVEMRNIQKLGDLIPKVVCSFFAYTLTAVTVCMNPECHKCSSTSESMHDFKEIVESYVEARIKIARDSAEHHV